MAKQSNAPRVDIYQRVTDQLVAALENAGEWERPWVMVGGGFPVNAKTKARYSGINTILLWLAQDAAGYGSSGWATYQQWAEKGAQVRKGEKSSMIYKFMPFSELKDERQKPKDEQSAGGFLKTYCVFNSAQVDGYEAAVPVLPNLAQRIEHAEAFFANCGVPVIYGGNVACYIPSRDEIRMPPIEAFTGKDAEQATARHLSTLSHEFTHATGHKSRLNRELDKKFTSHGRYMEELVAEIGAAFVCAHLGIQTETRDDHAAYLKHYIAALKADKRAAFEAARCAQKACDWMIGQQPVEVEEELAEAA